MIASQNGHADVVDTLLQHGASVDLQGNVSFELLFYFIVYNVLLCPMMLVILHDQYTTFL